MRTTHRGFTLVEILVATAVLSIFMIGMLNLLDTSTRVSQLESELTDTQENVRFAAYHILRTARMLGGANMPFAGQAGSSDVWVAGQLISNPTSPTVTIPGYTAVSVLPGSDVLTLRGFFEVSPFFTDPQTALGSGTVTIREYNAAGQAVNDLSAFTPAALTGRGVVFMGQGAYCVGKIAGATVTGSGTDRQLVMSHQQGEEPWTDLNVGGAVYPPGFQVYRVGVLESYTYYVDRENTLRRVRLAGGTVQPEPVAINIGGLQVALGVDADGDGIVAAGEWVLSPPDATSLINQDVLALRLTVLGRTRMRVPEWDEPEATFEAEDGSATGLERGAKWRRMQVVVNLRNYTLRGNAV